ncbi:MAG TPA: SDR family oxidoreductase [Polyangiaceae bacterium]|nr:SDR family oxidoreductase [Polyangiaceae bacterium]
MDKTRDGEGRTVLVTGASAGIGKALANVFAEHGFGVVLTARREDRLAAAAREIEERHRVRAQTVAADLADPAARGRLFDEVSRRQIVVDALVNNAGYGVAGKFARSDWATHQTFLEVMVTAVAHLTHLFEPGMKGRGYGRILNVSSLAGLMPGSAGHTLYAAAKAFLIKFSESLALEHAGDGVMVSALCPGFTYSEFHDVLGNRSLVSKLPSYLWMDADTVARQGYAAVMAGRVVCVPGAVNQAIASVTRLIPEPIALRIMRRQAKRIRVGD